LITRRCNRHRAADGAEQRSNNQSKDQNQTKPTGTEQGCGETRRSSSDGPAQNPPTCHTDEQRDYARDRKYGHRRKESRSPLFAGGPRPLREGLAFDHLQYCVQSSFDTSSEIAFAEPRHDDFLDDTVRDGVRQNAFKAVADFNAELSILLGDEEDRAVVESLLTDFPRFGDSNAEIFQRITFETWNSKYRDLMPGFLFESRKA
jgi:hypothetical protein